MISCDCGASHQFADRTDLVRGGRVGDFAWGREGSRDTLHLIVPDEVGDGLLGDADILHLYPGAHAESNWARSGPVNGWDGNREFPTLKPSIQARGIRPGEKDPSDGWHGFFVRGRLCRDQKGEQPLTAAPRAGHILESPRRAGERMGIVSDVAAALGKPVEEVTSDDIEQFRAGTPPAEEAPEAPEADLPPEIETVPEPAPELPPMPGNANVTMPLSEVMEKATAETQVFNAANATIANLEVQIVREKGRIRRQRKKATVALRKLAAAAIAEAGRIEGGA